jgi:hypothetical protein
MDPSPYHKNGGVPDSDPGPGRPGRWTTRIRRGSWILLGLLALGAALVLTATAGIASVDLERHIFPGPVEMNLKPGWYYVFQETHSRIGGQIYSSKPHYLPVESLRIQWADQPGGIAPGVPSFKPEYDRPDHRGVCRWTFHCSKAGRARISLKDPPVPIVLAIGKVPIGLILWTGIPGVLLLVGGTLVLAYRFFTRSGHVSESRREHPLARREGQGPARS